MKITQNWHNKDLTLEEFGFNIQIDGHPVNLAFGENDPIRTMSRKMAIGALIKILHEELNHTNSLSVIP